MTKELNYKGFEKYLYKYIDRTPDWHNQDAVQYIFKFPNGYGASVIKNPGSYGNHRDLWELGVLYFVDDEEWHLCYDTEITDDVIGYLSDDKVCELLAKIKELEE